MSWLELSLAHRVMTEAADPKCWQSAWRKPDYIQLFHTSKSFPFLRCAVCFLFPVDLHSFAVSLPPLFQSPLYFAPWLVHPRWAGWASPPCCSSSGLPFPPPAFCTLHRAFPASTALEASWGDAISQLFLFLLPFFLGPMVWLSLISGE